MSSIIDNIRAEIKRSKQEIAANKRRLQSEFAVKINIDTIKQILSAMNEMSSARYDQDVTRLAKEALGRGLWDAVPESVVTIDFGEGSITRNTKLPEDQCISWNLKQIDDHAAMLSKQIGQRWEPVVE